MPKVQKFSFNEDSISLDDSMNSEDQKDVLKQLAASIAIQVESTKESNKISRLEFKRKVEEFGSCFCFCPGFSGWKRNFSM